MVHHGVSHGEIVHHGNTSGGVSHGIPHHYPIYYIDSMRVSILSTRGRLMEGATR